MASSNLKPLYDDYYVNYFLNSCKNRLTDNNYHYDVTNLSDRKNQIGLEHYLIKCAKEGKTLTAKEKQLVFEIYDNFHKHPEEFVNSNMILDRAIDLFAPNQETANKIRSYRSRYFNKQDIKKLYQQYMSGSLDRVQTDRFFSLLNISLRENQDINKNRHFKIYEEVAKGLFNKYIYIRDMSNAELMFYGQYVANTFNSKAPYKVDINIFSDLPNKGGHEIRYHIFVNKESTFRETLSHYTQVICHENRHAYQEYNSRNKNTKEGFELAVAEIFNRFLSKDGYNPYSDNYRYQDIELDAEQSGYFNGGVMLSMLDQRKLRDDLYEEKERRLNRRNLYAEMLNFDGRKCSKDHYIVSNLDTIIAGKPELLEEYPVLRAFYKQDGTKRVFGNLMGNAINEDFETRGLFENFFNEALFQNQLDTLDLKKAGPETTRKLLEKLGSINKDYVWDINTFLKDTNVNLESTNETQVINTTLYKLRAEELLIDYICNHYKEFLALREGKLTNRNALFAFILPFRDFSMDKVKNPVLKNNPQIKRRLDIIKAKTDFLTYHFNRVYVSDRMVDVPPELMSQMITTPDGKQMQFVEYFKDIHNQMDGHMEITIDNKKIYVGDLIGYYKEAYKKSKDSIQQYETEEESNGFRIG